MNHKVCRNPTIIPALAKLNKLNVKWKDKVELGCKNNVKNQIFIYVWKDLEMDQTKH